MISMKAKFINETLENSGIKKIVDKTIGIRYKAGLVNAKRLENYSVYTTNTFDKSDVYRKLGKEKFLNYFEKEVNCLFESRVEEFKNLWGKQDFVFHGEYQMYAWLIECNKCEALIFSGKGKGTSVEIILDEEDNPKGPVEDLFFAFKKIMQSFPKK